MEGLTILTLIWTIMMISGIVYTGITQGGDAIILLLTDGVEKAFSNALYTIKDGQIVVKDGDIVSTKQSHTIWTNVIGYEEEEKQIIDSIMPFFTQYYSVKWENYQVHDHYVPNPTRVDVEAK